jgi:tetratricopeptide (TPR) repeat protein
VNEAVTKLREIETSLQQQLGREPTAEELAGASGLAIDRVAEIVAAAREPIRAGSTRPRDRRTLAFALREQAVQQNETGHHAEAAAAAREAADLQRGLLDVAPPDRYRFDPHFLAAALDQLARALREQGQIAAADRAQTEGIGLIRAASAQGGADLENTGHFLASSLLGLARTRAADPATRPEAGKAFDEAIGIWEQLARRQEQIVVYRHALAVGLRFRGEFRLATGSVEQAWGDFNRSREILAPLAEQHPERSGCLADLGRAYLGLGRAARAGRDPGRAGEWFAKATDVLRDAARRDPDNLMNRRALTDAEAGK